MGNRLSWSPYDKTPVDPPIPAGERVTVRGQWFGVVESGPCEGSRFGGYRVRLDPEHEHFTPVIGSSADEIAREQDYMVYEAQERTRRALEEITRRAEQVASAVEALEAAKQEYAREQVILREAKKGNYDEGLAPMDGRR